MSYYMMKPCLVEDVICKRRVYTYSYRGYSLLQPIVIIIFQEDVYVRACVCISCEKTVEMSSVCCAFVGRCVCVLYICSVCVLIFHSIRWSLATPWISFHVTWGRDCAMFYYAGPISVAWSPAFNFIFTLDWYRGVRVVSV